MRWCVTRAPTSLQLPHSLARIMAISRVLRASDGTELEKNSTKAYTGFLRSSGSTT